MICYWKSWVRWGWFGKWEDCASREGNFLLSTSRIWIFCFCLANCFKRHIFFPAFWKMFTSICSIFYSKEWETLSISFPLGKTWIERKFLSMVHILLSCLCFSIFDVSVSSASPHKVLVSEGSAAKLHTDLPASLAAVVRQCARTGTEHQVSPFDARS